ncbi:MAG: decaprenyl-phosphate phosphoribosyltransferase [Phycisphaerales bacterium]
MHTGADLPEAVALTPDAEPTHAPSEPATGLRLARALVRLARPKQWAKSGFALVGPFYAYPELIDAGATPADILVPAFFTAGAFSFASSGCYVVNDLIDRDADRLHPRKRRRPIASGAVTPRVAIVYAIVLFAISALCLLVVPERARALTGLCVGLYVANVFAYGFYFKRKVIGDVVSLSMGFVLRVLGGCAAVVVAPTTWLLNVTLFLSMFLAFGKRLGERRTLAHTGATGGSDAQAHRAVQGRYTDTLLQMAVVVTAVGTLMTYAGYLQDNEDAYMRGFNLMWLTILPATYGMLRCIVLLETGEHDDPTELAYKDRGFVVAAIAFATITAALVIFEGRLGIPAP